MEQTANPTMQRLMQSFMQFNKADWHQHTIDGCSMSEIRVLFCVRRGMEPHCTAMKVSEISKMMHVTAPFITQMLKGLEAKGLVERQSDADDRRSVHLRLTDRGVAITQQATHSFADSIEGLMQFLGEEESNQLAGLLAKMFRYFHDKAASDGFAPVNGDAHL